MKTIRDVITYVEGRMGGKIVNGLFVGTGAGLFALEVLSEEKGRSLDALLYKTQRAELMLLLTKLKNADTE